MTPTETQLDDLFWAGLIVRIAPRPYADMQAERLLPSLTARERDQHAAYQSERRRADWLAGRWCAKRLLEPFCDPGPSCISTNSPEIISQQSGGPTGPPTAKAPGFAVPAGGLSLTHSDAVVAAVLLQAADAAGLYARVGVGIDAVDRVSPTPGFAETWFSGSDCHALEHLHAGLTEGWAAKEAAFKALSAGEPFRPRSMRLSPIDGNRDRLRVSLFDTQPRRGQAAATAEVRLLRHGESAIAVARAVQLGCHKTRIEHDAAPHDLIPPLDSHRSTEPGHQALS